MREICSSVRMKVSVFKNKNIPVPHSLLESNGTRKARSLPAPEKGET
jgi:hypothetical protein